MWLKVPGLEYPDQKRDLGHPHTARSRYFHLKGSLADLVWTSRIILDLHF
jgi:hypothetical protein